MQLAAISMAVEMEKPWGKEIIAAYRKWQRKRFKGYTASDSGAPPAENAQAGRLNPEKIRYLYLAENPETAVYEVRPTIGQHVSVATFKTTENIKIYDLVSEIKPKEDNSVNHDVLLFGEIQRRFSEPNAGDAYKYLPTQYLGEIIKQMGFDGLKFKRSLKNGGVNIVLFDDNKCKAISSDMIQVSDIELKVSNPEIYQLGDYFKVDGN